MSAPKTTNTLAQVSAQSSKINKAGLRKVVLQEMITLSDAGSPEAVALA